jgi:hypothetical protein
MEGADPVPATGGGVARRREEDGEQHPRGAAHGLAQLAADGAVELGRVREGEPVQRVDQGPRRSGERGSGIAVAGPGVEGIEIRLGGDQRPAAPLDQ